MFNAPNGLALAEHCDRRRFLFVVQFVRHKTPCFVIKKYYFFYMSQQEKTERRTEKERVKRGRKPVGRSKQIRCVTVDDYVWLTAIEMWAGKASRLVERLLSKYVQTPSIIPPHSSAAPTKP
jgi:hypothetical protein